MKDAWHNEIKPFKPEQYENIDLDRLTAFSIKFLVEHHVEPIFENIVVILFKMFPERFSLVGFNEYPDSNRVNRQLLHCRPKYRNYVVGSMRRGWMLTERGVVAAEEAEELLTNPLILDARKKRTTTKERTKSIHFVNEILRSQAYEKFIKGADGQIADIELCNVLHVNLDTPTSIVLRSIQKLVMYAKIVDNKDVIRFLEFTRQRLVTDK